MSKTEVVTDALRQEAKKWFALSDELHTVAGNVTNLTLDTSAFWCGDGVSIAAAPIYAGYQQFVQDRCREGAAEFDQIAGALNRAADEYDGSDEVSAATLTKIYGNL
ncbi:PE domain-containing protein [Actinoplanes sp. NPDC051859]|uniref:PE domain-containing protein n=1 Tax=Actinoplanes sp. NPDC051859 TaxID=3363909 RepID=UPI00379CA24B